MDCFFQAADLLFQKRLSPTGDAILASRKTFEKVNFNHVALFISDCELIHAVDPGGVERISLMDLLSSGQNIHVMRIKTLSQDEKNRVINKALAQLGKPYDLAFCGATDAFYCSSFIQFLFPQYFDLQPMTFKDKQTQMFHPYWLEHFKKIGQAIPEGALGTHPMGLFHSEYLSEVS
ncbi:MAG TPA: YiiX/YebB-like N1pC/P60 family cysteine hydrolase [Oligoflexia bacterium]|nr:YiiX/YebB-like N1pC/P60 family cysteine hydrolase [Oligoflexia bacterium]HMR25028.1 YiiX/YebB-like N1pC/P60 family cysteine hydrolase [Oligoflexia bacterium]